MTWPCIDHSGLSPSGRTSKRARAAWLKVQHDRLFPPGYWDDANKVAQPSRRDVLLAQAARLRDLAARGMSVRKFTREADRLEAEAARAE